MINEDCPVCGAKSSLLDMKEYTYVGLLPGESGDIKVETEYSVCNICESEIANPEQINRNADAVRKARHDAKL